MSCYIVGDDRLSAIAISMSKWKEKSWGCYIAPHEQYIKLKELNCRAYETRYNEKAEVFDDFDSHVTDLYSLRWGKRDCLIVLVDLLSTYIYQCSESLELEESETFLEAKEFREELLKEFFNYKAQHEDAHDRIDSIIHCGYKPLMDGILYGKEEDFI